jgi:transketolase
MEIPTIYVLTHDSIGLGEDGPTHQPVEQLASLRAMPHMIVMRPGDANEVVEAWKVIAQLKHNPVSLVLTRQAVPTIDRTKYAAVSGVAKGGYVLADAPGGKPDVILIGTGSEVSLCVETFEVLKTEGIKARVVSMPSWELFDDQPQESFELVGSAERLAAEDPFELCPNLIRQWGSISLGGLAHRGNHFSLRRFQCSAPARVSVNRMFFTPVLLQSRAERGQTPVVPQR